MFIEMPLSMRFAHSQTSSHQERETVHSESYRPFPNAEGNRTDTSVATGEDHPGLIFLIALLAGFLLFLIISLLLPSGCQNRLCRFFRGEAENFNYIDVGLYKTRHSMYRREIYLQQMRRSIATNTNTTHSSMSSPPSGRESDLGTPASSASTDRSGVLAPLLDDHLTTIDEHTDERTSRSNGGVAVDVSGTSTSSLLVRSPEETVVPVRQCEQRPSALTMSKSDSALRDCCEHCTPRIIVNPANDATPRKSVIFVSNQEPVFLPSPSGSITSFV